MKKIFSQIGIVALTATMFTACDKDDNPAPPPPPPPTQLRPTIDYASLTAASDYFQTFKDSAGATTVNFDGQTTRQDMLAELNSLMISGSTGTIVDSSKLSNMFANTGSPFTNAALNAATDKTLKSKTATSFAAADADAERQKFEKWFGIIADASKSTLPAADGQAGVATGTADATKKYLVDANGIEYGQLVQKGLIGACFFDQIVNTYLGTDKMSADNKTIVSGKNYTQLEHHWDEAYGYVTRHGTYPLRINGVAQERFLGGYLRQVPDSTNFFLAFSKGRAAIVNGDNATRDAQIAFIRTKAEDAIARVGVSYLNKTAKAIATDPAVAMHAFGESLGFVYSLRFAHNAKVNKAKSDEYINKLMGAKGFYSLTSPIINEVKKAIADTFGFPENYESAGH
jgi:hypothetical protein